MTERLQGSTLTSGDSLRRFAPAPSEREPEYLSPRRETASRRGVINPRLTSRQDPSPTAGFQFQPRRGILWFGTNGRVHAVTVKEEENEVQTRRRLYGFLRFFPK